MEVPVIKTSWVKWHKEKLAASMAWEAAVETGQGGRSTFLCMPPVLDKVLRMQQDGQDVMVSNLPVKGSRVC